MASFNQYRAEYEKNWSKLTIRPERKAEIEKEARRLLAGKPRYQEIERRTGVPWWFIGLCHYRESHFNFSTYLGNGQSLSHKTTIVPEGRGPFFGDLAFENGAVDALTFQKFVGLQDWSIGISTYRLEGFNGYGYHGHSVPSPYLYGGSTVYVRGKYTRDHYFDPNFVDTQLGTLVILKKLIELDPSIKIGAPITTATKAASGAAAAGGAATVAVAASGFSWGAVAAVAIIALCIAGLVWHFLKKKD